MKKTLLAVVIAMFVMAGCGTPDAGEVQVTDQSNKVGGAGGAKSGAMESDAGIKSPNAGG